MQPPEVRLRILFDSLKTRPIASFGSEEDSFCYAFAFAEKPPEGPVAGACGREFGIRRRIPAVTVVEEVLQVPEHYKDPGEDYRYYFSTEHAGNLCFWLKK